MGTATLRAAVKPVWALIPGGRVRLVNTTLEVEPVTGAPINIEMRHADELWGRILQSLAALVLALLASLALLAAFSAGIERPPALPGDAQPPQDICNHTRCVCRICLPVGLVLVLLVLPPPSYTGSPNVEWPRWVR